MGHRRAVALLALAALLPATLMRRPAQAYTAAGDRTFPATLVLPQIGPSDAVWAPFNTQPEEHGLYSQITGTFAKTITERFGLQIEDGVTRYGHFTGAQNLDLAAQYEAILDTEHEFLLSLQFDHEFGGSGSPHVGNYEQGASQPAISFGKGLGDLPVAALRPLAVTGFAGFQVGEGTRANVLNAGFSLQYSFPYLLSKVTNLDLPPLLRGLTPIIEVELSSPTSPGNGTSRTLMVAPGVSYTQGTGWEFGIEALIPANKATGAGIGVIAQFVVQLDYLLPDTILGHPLFPPR